MDEIMKYGDTAGNEIELSEQIVRKLLCTDPNLTSQEIALFLQLCKYQKLNPFLGEAHLIKYSANQPASRVMGIGAFRKRASLNPKYRGHEVETFGNVPNMTATCKVYVDGYQVPISATVDYAEYVREKDEWVNNQKTGKKIVSGTWAEKPKTMLKKVAEVHALRMAFPSDFSGIYSEDEMPRIEERLESTPIVPYVVQELKVAHPASPETNPQPEAKIVEQVISEKQRKLMWARAKELNISEDLLRAHLKEEHGLDSTRLLPMRVFDALMLWFDSSKTEEPPNETNA